MAEIKNLEHLQNTEYSLKKIFEEAEDFLPLLGTDYVELYVGNAKQSAHFYKTALGFQSEAYAGLETGATDKVSYVLKQGKIRLVLTTPLTPDGPINQHINKHGDGVKVVALWVEDATRSWKETTARGANPLWSRQWRKTSTVKWFALVFIPMVRRYTFSSSARITMGYFCRVIALGNLTTIQSQLG